MQEFILVPEDYEEREEGYDEPFGDKEDEIVVILATSAEEALTKAGERYDLGDGEVKWVALPVALIDLAEGAESQTPAAFGIKTFVPNADGQRAVAVFFSESEDDDAAQLVSFLDAEGDEHDYPVAMSPDDDMAVVDVTTRRWPYPEDPRYAHMVVGYDFAKLIAAAAPASLGEEGLVVEREGDEPIAVGFADISDEEEAVILGYVQRDGTVGEAPYGFPSFKVAHAAAGLAFAQSEHDVPTGCLYTGLAFAQSTFEGAEV